MFIFNDMGLKVYVGKDRSSTLIVDGVHPDGRWLEGCCIKGNSLGYSKKWVVDFFTPLEGELKFDVNEFDFNQGKLYVKSRNYDDCVIDFNVREIIVKPKIEKTITLILKNKI